MCLSPLFFNFFPSKVEPAIAAKFHRRRVFHRIDYIRMSVVPDSPVEMPDGTLRCQRHGLEICGICCCDYSFMRDVLKEQEESKPESDEEDDEDWGPYEEEQSKTEMRLCNVCSEECKKMCSRCKIVFCECNPLPPVVEIKNLLPRPDCGPEHQKQVREEQARVVEESSKDFSRTGRCINLNASAQTLRIRM